MDAKSLGHLSDLYYKKALQILGFPMNQEYKVFTDGKKEDLNKSFRFARNLDSVDTNELNSWQVLKIMALHKNFIIANSSFSWWAANLKRSSAGKVIAPKIWFLKDGPEGIHNPSWILI
jgi:glutathione peroxidase-family protein